MANHQQRQPTQSGEQDSSNGGIFSGVTDKLGSAVGGGQGSGDDQSYLSKGIDVVQQSVYGQKDYSGSTGEETSRMGQEKQEVHAAVDGAHPEQVSEFLRDKYHSTTEELKKEEAGG